MNARDTNHRHRGTQNAIFANKANFNFHKAGQIPWTKPLMMSGSYQVPIF
jgi:hypothetical protein